MRQPTEPETGAARPSGVRPKQSSANSLLLLSGLGLALFTLAGCGMFQANAQVGPDLKPHLGAGVSIPLGK